MADLEEVPQEGGVPQDDDSSSRASSPRLVFYNNFSDIDDEDEESDQEKEEDEALLPETDDITEAQGQHNDDDDEEEIEEEEKEEDRNVVGSDTNCKASRDDSCTERPDFKQEESEPAVVDIPSEASRALQNGRTDRKFPSGVTDIITDSLSSTEQVNNSVDCSDNTGLKDIPEHSLRVDDSGVSSNQEYIPDGGGKISQAVLQNGSFHESLTRSSQSQMEPDKIAKPMSRSFDSRLSTWRSTIPDLKTVSDASSDLSLESRRLSLQSSQELSAKESCTENQQESVPKHSTVPNQNTPARLTDKQQNSGGLGYLSYDDFLHDTQENVQSAELFCDDLDELLPPEVPFQPDEHEHSNPEEFDTLDEYENMDHVEVGVHEGGDNYESTVPVWDGRLGLYGEECEFAAFDESSLPKRTGKHSAMPRRKGAMKRGSGRQSTYMMQSPLMMLFSVAKESGYDVPHMLENAEELGMNMPFPCLQCYENMDTSSGYSMNSMFNLMGNTEPTDTRCKRCGGKILTLATFGTTLKEMRKLFIEKGLVPHDVYPDGNCLFATVADQLRVRGDFRFTVDRLRQASVEYLRQNPHAEDGTHYELFLSEETWDQYLQRMSKDGVWGDHMVLSALSNILKKNIVIYGGQTGRKPTVISPRGQGQILSQGVDHTDNKPEGEGQETKDRTVTDEDAQNKESTEDSPVLENKEDLSVGRQKKDQDKRSEVIGDDQNKQVEEGGENAKGGEEEKDFDIDWESSIVLGHISESHYLSLRRKEWKSILFDSIMAGQGKQQTFAEPRKSGSDTSSSLNDALIDPTSHLPLPHINFLLRQIAQSKQIMTTCPKVIVSGFSPTIMNTKRMKLELVGDPYNNLNALSSGAVDSLMPDMTVFFPNMEMETTPSIVPVEVMSFLSPDDTYVRSVQERSSAKQSDFIMHECIKLGTGFVQLVPVRGDYWKGKTTSLPDGKSVLLPFKVTSPFKPPPLAWPGVTEYLNVQPGLAFCCDWPDEALEWKTRKRAFGWPSSSIVKSVVDEGCNVIPLQKALTLEENIKHQSSVILETVNWEELQMETVWIISFEAAVMALSREVTEEQRQVFFLLRMFLRYWLQEEGVIPKSCLVSVFFRSCETFEKSDWKTDPGKCLLHMMERLHESLRDGNLPCYFMSKRNLLKHVSRSRLDLYCRKMEILRNQLFICLYFCLDVYRLLETELTNIVDVVIEDIFRFAKHRDPNRSKLESFIPASTHLIEDYIYQGDYEMAQQVILDLVEETTLLDQHQDELPINFLFRTVFDLNSIHIGYRWCFAFYLDVSLNTKLTKEVCKDNKTVSIGDIFGPEIIEEFGAVPIPACFDIHRADFYFVREFSMVLNAMKNNKATANALRYYVEALEEMYPDFELLQRESTDSLSSYRYYDYQPVLLTNLCSIYVTLFNAYLGMGRTEEFADCVGKLEKITNIVGTKFAYRNLAMIYSYLGEQEKYLEVYNQMKSSGYSTMDSYQSPRSGGVMSMLSMLGIQ